MRAAQADRITFVIALACLAATVAARLAGLA